MKTIYFNGNILTMETPLYAEAVLVEDGKICAVGDKEEVFELADKHTVFQDLQGRTMLPAFIDSHGHLTSFAQTMSLVKLSDCKSFSELKKALSDAAAKSDAKEPLTGFGYDHNNLAEGRHPDRRLLDEISAERPILIANANGHMGVANTPMLKLLGIDSDTPDPPGGKIGRDADGAPNGYLEETAFTVLSTKISKPSLSESAKFVRYAEKEYLKFGITTVQDGLTRAPEWKLLKYMAENKLLSLDVVCYPDAVLCPEIPAENPEYADYCNNLRIGGVKLMLDGSPQGRTAWISKPYEGETEYRGYPVHPDAEVRKVFERAIAEERQILVHCNGDAAAEQMLDCWREALRAVRAQREEPAGFSDLRPVMIHAQLLRRGQLPELARMGVIPSFFVAHAYYWGDVHLKNLGGRANFISPARTAGKLDIPYTFHQDTPVLPPDMLRTVQCAVTRTTKAGEQLSEQERVTTLDALAAVTKNAAYQYFEEDAKGTIRVGKLADFVVLDKNPLLVSPEHIAEIKVLETIRRGESVYRR